MSLSSFLFARLILVRFLVGLVGVVGVVVSGSACSAERAGVSRPNDVDTRQSEVVAHPKDVEARSVAAAAHADDTVDALIARGRAALDAGRAAEAQKIFEEAAAKDSDSLRTRVWVLRSWLAQGRTNDTLNAADELAKTGAKGPELDYIYGTAFALIARVHIAQQNGGGLIDLNLKDAIAYLEKATTADPERFSDAFALLAESAWYARELDVARNAAEKAAARMPKSADAAFMLGRVALAQYAALAADANRKALADEHWEVARASLAKALELLNGTRVPAQRTTLAKAHVDLGHALKWKDKNEEAAREYSAAMAADPAVVNYEQILGALGKEAFTAAIEAGAKGFKASVAAEGSADGGVGAGQSTKSDAGLLWWLGWGRFEKKEYAKADEAFSEAVKKEPAFQNSWYYIALARHHQQDYDGAIAALRRNFDESAVGMTASLASSAEANLRILDFLIGYCAERQRNLEAAFLSELQAAVAPENPNYWNNVGLFYRDAGAFLRASENPDDHEQAPAYFEKSYAAYTQALEISPDNPALLNDAAVILHYYLDREAETAKSMYKKAAERAEAELERTDLKPDVRELYETALRDAKNNLAKLERGDKREN